MKKKCIIFLILNLSGPNTDYGSLASWGSPQRRGESRRHSPRERLQLFVLLISFEKMSGLNDTIPPLFLLKIWSILLIFDNKNVIYLIICKHLFSVHGSIHQILCEGMHRKAKYL